MYKLQKCAFPMGLPLVTQIRRLNLQEYQSKTLMSKFGINIQKFQIASTEQDAVNIAKNFQASEYVVKAQILAGGRGKGTFTNGFRGGVHLTKSASDIPQLVRNMLGHRLITKQTSSTGVMVNKVMVAHALDIASEMYLALLMDRSSGGLVVVSSPHGGVDIEEVAAQSSEAILKTTVNINKGITKDDVHAIANHLQLSGQRQKEDLARQLSGLFELFLQHDCTMIEINPLGLTPAGELVCFDAKLNFDDNAAFRQREIFELHDPDAAEQDPREVDAALNGLTYIGLHGNIGCVVNGAGLAMATMDIVKLNGGLPANFLDLGGGVTAAQVRQAFRILAGDPRVKTIFVNIFGGIVNCATVAEGLTTACSQAPLAVPLVVRLQGTNVDSARRILAASGIPMQMSTDLDEAAKMAVRSVTQ